MGDMLVPFLALADGESQYTVANLTSHLSTNIEVVKMFIKTEIEAIKRTSNILIKVRGVGLNMM
jgi:RNA 3'-terminal phosphate cyclase